MPVESCAPTTDLSVRIIAETAGNIALHNFEWRYITLIFFNSSLYFGIDVFLKTYHKSVMVGHGVFNTSKAQTTRQYILFSANLENMLHMLEWMYHENFYSTGRYIIICTSVKLIECDEARAMHLFWRYKIVNVIFLRSANSDKNSSVVGYTYYALHDDGCSVGDPVEIQEVVLCPTNTSECRDLFPMKLMNLHKCPFIVSCFIQYPYLNFTDGEPYGLDGDVMKLIAEGLNSSLQVMTPRVGFSWGSQTDDGNWTGSLGDVYNEWANASMTSGALTVSRYTSFQISYVYNYKTLVWVTSPAEPIPSSLKLLHPFKPIAFAMLALSFFIIVALGLITTSQIWLKISKITKIDISPNIIFQSWLVCMGQPLLKLTRKGTHMNTALLWIWYCFLARTLYQTSLITSLKGDFYFDVIDNLDDLLNEGYTCGGVQSLKDFYINDSKVLSNFVEVNVSDYQIIMRNISMGINFVLGINLLLPLNFEKNGGRLRVLSGQVASTPLVLFFKKFSPLADPLNIIVRRLHESGLINMVLKNYMDLHVVYNEDHSHESLRLVHYKSCYLMLVFGGVMSGICFSIELVWAKMRLLNVSPSY